MKRSMLLSNGVFFTIGAILCGGSAHAVSLYNGYNYGNNLQVNLTTQLSYTGMWRVNSPSAVLKAAEDGDANFQHGMVANLLSVVPVLDIRDGDFGAHFSGQFYLNTSYLGTNQNNLTPWSSAIYTAKQTNFASGTRNVDGQNAQLLDAFVYAGHTFADGQSVQFKLGRTTLMWGQSLFFPADGIAGGQAPINIISAQNLINPQAQQVFMPVAQAIVTYEPTSSTMIQAYYQFEWRHDYFQGEGAYFSSPLNVIGPGGGWLGLGSSCSRFGLSGVNCGLTRTKDLNPEHQNGQFGLSLQQQVGKWDLGAYVERFDAKAPELGIFGPDALGPVGNPAAGAVSIGNYQFVYPRDIWLQGISFSTNVGAANVAGEFSVREHQPLVLNNQNAFFIQPGQNANSNPGYAVGDTWDAQLSTIYVSPPLPFDPGGVAFAGEIILNHLIDVTKNRALLRTDGQATAGAMDVSITPTYNDVLPNLQITFPLSLSYDYLGRSEVDASIYHGNGSYDAGITATYKTNWIASVAYQGYFGKPNTVYNPLVDRGFISFNLQHTF